MNDASPADPSGTPDASASGDRAVPEGLRVLVVDDSSTIRRSAELFLTQAGCRVSLAEDGFDALARLADEAPDAVFCDILMPRLDGYQTCALIKDHPRHAATPVILLSSRDGLFDRARGRLAGADRHLSKPFTADDLLRALASVLPFR